MQNELGPAGYRVGREPAGRGMPGLRAVADASWRLLVVAGVVALVGYLAVQLQVVVIPVVLAVLLAALLAPAVRLIARPRWMPRAAATVLVILGGLAVLGLILYGVAATFIAGLPELQQQLGRSLTQLRDQLAGSPFHVSAAQLDGFGNGLLQTVQQHRAELTAGALGVAGTVGELVTGALLTLFTLIFFLYDGGRIWRFLLNGVPRAARGRVDVAGRRAFASLVAYTRAVALVAVSDAVVVGLGLWVIRVPLVIPLAALVFLAAFVPTVGAIVSGAVAVLVALVAGGFVPALLVVALLVVVGQLEGHVLQPLLLGRAVRLHPLAVVLPVAAGLVVAGVIGALLAVPLVTALDSGTRALSETPAADPDDVDPLDPASARAGGRGKNGADRGPRRLHRASPRRSPASAGSG